MGLNVADIRVKHCATAAEVGAINRAVLERKRARRRPPQRIRINDLTPGSFPIAIMREIKFNTVNAHDPVVYPSVASIIDLVCQTYGVTKMDIVSQRRHREIVLPRQLAQALASRLTPHSLPMIAKHFGGRDHTTILHAKQKIERMRGADSEFNAIVKDLENRLGGYNPQIKQYGERHSWSRAMDTRLGELIATNKTWRTITDTMNREFDLTLAHSSCYGRMYHLGLRRPKAKQPLIMEAA
jgi:hypothetical protein